MFSAMLDATEYWKNDYSEYILRFLEGFFATFILICSYLISGFSAGNKKYV